MTPSCTSGVNSLTAPFVEFRPHVHATFRSFTVSRLICVSGLCAQPSYVRRQWSQSPGGGLRSIASVTGVRRSSGARRTASAACATGERPRPRPPPRRGRRRRRSAPGRRSRSWSRHLRQDDAVQERPHGQHDQTRARARVPRERSKQTHMTVSSERILAAAGSAVRQIPEQILERSHGHHRLHRCGAACRREAGEDRDENRQPNHCCLLTIRKASAICRASGSACPEYGPLAVTATARP